MKEDKFDDGFVLSKSMILVMAMACGITVANLYYIQPLLAEIAKEFNVTQVSIGFVAMLTQIGYAIGMLLLLPLADIKEKRSLIVLMLFCAAAALTLMSFSFNVTVLAIASFLVGFTSVVPQLIVPLASQLSKPEERGKTIGNVMSGLLIGILISRTFSGLLGKYFGWRVVYVIAVIMMLTLAFFLRKLIPVGLPVSKIKYKELFKSMLYFIKTEPVLREAALNGASMFAAFSIFWTSLSFLLASYHYKMGSDAAGLFGLVGVTGALAAPVVGRIADKRSPKFTIGIGMIIVVAAYICFYIFGFKLIGLVIGVILLDLGVQSCQISNQARVHAISEEARNRVNTVFMVSYFLGGSIGSFVGAYSYSHFGWYGVCTAGLITQGIALACHKLGKDK
ncbi:MFS transporter [Clostridium sp. C8-1-8]|uniref:MFS transporter n=1 Tax=Clostridium sp. C8-1-8 TaxID=2698831 RepID=UPI0013682986|nr:MFS transporter [Clostridium sp. C8-1-8]